MIIELCVDYKQYTETPRISESSEDLEKAFKGLNHCAYVQINPEKYK